ncbi:unnamed protein product [Angiostrongylus costaricensis]|uniref:DNA (cytosine-5-)-methyltransferase n=1 Tax=Angiostrongylus costaricensis TaxID=334426 RepID=A0A0R3PX79_ANGCS|nr:unnamed protein product [Angiostrongylus costaricensis]
MSIRPALNDIRDETKILKEHPKSCSKFRKPKWIMDAKNKIEYEKCWDQQSGREEKTAHMERNNKISNDRLSINLGTDEIVGQFTHFNGVDDMMKPHCIIIENTVTALCNAMNNGMCRLDNAMMIGNIPAMHLSISGSLTTTNVIMANWSREMWQGVVNRAVRMLASGPFRTNFASAFATVD